jgi:hypothetical protein
MGFGTSPLGDAQVEAALDATLRRLAPDRHSRSRRENSCSGRSSYPEPA